MAKDAFYFKHDSNARNDPKLLDIRAVYGPAGYGVFWMLIEMMRDEDNHSLSYPLSAGIAFGLGMQKEDVMKIIDTCVEIGLFEKDGDLFSSPRMNREMDNMRELSTKNSINGRLGGIKKSKNKQPNSERQANAKRTPSQKTIQDNTRQEKTREEESSSKESNTAAAAFSENLEKDENAAGSVIDELFRLELREADNQGALRFALLDACKKDPTELKKWTDEIYDFRQKKALSDYQSLQRKAAQNAERIDLEEREIARKKNQLRTDIFEKFKGLPDDEMVQIRNEALVMSGQISVVNDFILITEISKIFETKYPEIVAELTPTETKIPDLEKIIETQKIEIEKIKVELDFHRNISNGLLKHAQGMGEKDYEEFTDLVSDYSRELLDKDDMMDRNLATIYARVNAGKQKFPDYFYKLIEEQKIKEKTQ